MNKKLIARLKDLGTFEKYYGTIVEFVNPLNNKVVQEQKFWLTFMEGTPDNISYEPSDRLLFNNALTREDWDSDASVTIEDGQKSSVRKEYSDLACDHFEDQFSYLTAKLFVEAFNKEFSK